MFSNTVDTFTPLVGNDGTADDGGGPLGGAYWGGGGAEAEGPASGVYCRGDCC
jgi:hypothetical protein